MDRGPRHSPGTSLFARGIVVVDTPRRSQYYL